MSLPSRLSPAPSYFAWLEKDESGVQFVDSPSGEFSIKIGQILCATCKREAGVGRVHETVGPRPLCPRPEA